MRTKWKFELVTSAPLRVAARKAPLVLLPTWLMLSGCFGSALWDWTSSSNEPDVSASEFQRLHREAALAPSEAYWPHRLAELHLAAGNADSARVHCDAALDRNADYAPALSLRSQMYWDTGDHQDAVVLLQAAEQRLRPFPAELSVALALHLDAFGEFEAADEIFTALPPETPALRQLDGYRRLRGDDYTDSLDSARALAEANPNVAAHQNNIGIALLYAGQPHEAKRALERALELDPRLPGPHYNLAIVERFYFFQDEAARDHLRSYLQLASDDPDGLTAIFAQGTENAKGGGAK